jgi:hypothetical protein
MHLLWYSIVSYRPWALPLVGATDYLNHWARHGGCLAQVGVRDGIVQQTRLTDGLAVSFIRVCMKVCAAGFSDIFCDRSSISPPNCSVFSNTRI